MSRRGNSFAQVLIVMDDMMFVTNIRPMLDELKKKLVDTFEVKFFDNMKSFIGWEVTRDHTGIQISQVRYTKELLKKYALDHFNGT